MRPRLPYILAFVLLAAGSAPVPKAAGEVHFALEVELASGPADALVLLAERADLSAAASLPSKEARGRFVYRRLSETAARTQVPVLAELAARGVEAEPFWIVNAVRARLDRTLAEALARRSDVASVVPVSRLRRARPPAGPRDASSGARAIEWNVNRLRAPEVWAAGVTGEGVTVAALDTGVQWDHPALIDHYRGWDGATVDHDYAWWDAVHATADSCGPDTPGPCDVHGHGTHVTGTMCGDDGGANRIGVAPGAEWIHCRIWEPALASDLTYALECLQWMLAPTERDGTNPDPARAPHVLSNSWICEPSEGCVDVNVLRAAVDALRAAGIVVVAGAGNDGPACATIRYPPGMYETVVTVGATDILDDVTPFSSRGPVTIDGSGRLEPDVMAPGLDVRSSFLHDTYFVWAGTSMATPHVAGVVALVIAANPAIAGHVEDIERILVDSTVPLPVAQTCGGIPGSEIPNPVSGHGRIDAWEAYSRAIAWPTAVGEGLGEGAAGVRLHEPWPNPAALPVTVRFETGRELPVRLDVVGVTGRRVRRLVPGGILRAGTHERVWDGRDADGRPVAAGTYFLHLKAGGVRETRRVTIAR
jgi:hypothetical protein